MLSLNQTGVRRKSLTYSPSPLRFHSVPIALFGLRVSEVEPTPGFEPGTFSLPSGLRSLANSS
jgi:hypothetical protein